MSLEIYLIKVLRLLPVRLETSFDYIVTVQDLLILLVKRIIDFFTPKVSFSTIASISIFGGSKNVIEDQGRATINLLISIQ